MINYKFYQKMLRLFLTDAKTRKQLCFVIISFALSLSFILCNMGLMDGYELSFKRGLQEFNADFSIHSREGFFAFNEDILEKLKQVSQIQIVSPVIQTEAFLVANNQAKGVMVRGIYPQDPFAKKMIQFSLHHGDIVVGYSLAQEWGLAEGSKVFLMFSKGGSQQTDLPQMREFIVRKIVKHKLHIRDSRSVYVNVNDIKDVTNANGKINLLLVYLKNSAHVSKGEFQTIQQNLESKMEYPYLVRPYWHDFSGLLEAVEIEKFSISISLQLVVLVALFNMLSFLQVLYDKKLHDIFLLRALGVRWQMIQRFFYFFIFLIWLVSLLGAFLLTKVFDALLRNLSILQVPGKIYELSQLSLEISNRDILLVVSVSFFWVYLVSWFGLYSLKKRPLLSVLRGQYD